MRYTSRAHMMLGSAIVAGLAMATAAEGAVVDLRNAAAAEAGRFQQFTFEASSGANSVSGGLTLATATYGSGTGVTYVAGFDNSSLALKPQVLSSTSGAGLKSSGTVVYPRTMTVEALVRVDGSTVLDENQYIVVGPGGPNRGFFMMYRQNDLKTGIGGLGLSDGNALRDILGNANTEPTLGDWLYIATTYTMTASPSETVVNAYVANLTAGERTLTRTLSDVTISGIASTTAAALGVGMFSGTSGEAFNGAIDEVTLYNTAMSQSALQAHLDAVYVPEPTALAAFGVAGAGLLMRRRRQAR